MQSYTITRVEDSPLPLDGRVAGTAWERAQTLSIDAYPWPQPGGRQATTVRLVYNSAAIYVLFHCEDRHSSAEVRTLNSSVCLDSCVEFFASMHPAQRPDYFNLEINCCGAMHLGFGSGRPERRLIKPELAASIHLAAALGPAPKHEQAEDRAWWIAAALPFATLGTLAGEAVSPRPETRWRANFYRCGGQTEPQYACWSPVTTPKPDYHRPECFGELIFG